MPRVKPTITLEYAGRLNEREDLRAASAEFSKLKGEALERTARKHGLPIGGNGSETYGAGSSFSWFRDRATVAAAEQAQDAAISRGDRVELIADSAFPHPIFGGLEEARARLATVNGPERRDLSTTATAGGNFAGIFSPTTAPGFIADHFAAAVRAKAVVAGIVRNEPLPRTGMKVETVRLSTGTATAVQSSEGATVQDTDLVEALVSSALCTISGQQDLSQQLLDRSEPGQAAGIDVALAHDLGNSYATSLDGQILYGSGTAPQLRGLLNVAGITAVAKTNGSPTGATNLAAIGDLVSQTSTAYGSLIETLLVHPRRLSWVRTKLGYSPEWPVPNVVACASLRTTDGVATNQDELYALASQEVILYGDAPNIRVSFDQTGSGTLTVKFVASGYAALLADARLLRSVASAAPSSLPQSFRWAPSNVSSIPASCAGSSPCSSPASRVRRSRPRPTSLAFSVSGKGGCAPSTTPSRSATATRFCSGLAPTVDHSRLNRLGSSWLKRPSRRSARSRPSSRESVPTK